MKSKNDNLILAINSLESRERLVLIWRYGLLGDEPLSVSEISKKIQRTRTRVYQIIKSALNKINLNLEFTEFHWTIQEDEYRRPF